MLHTTKACLRWACESATAEPRAFPGRPPPSLCGRGNEPGREPGLRACAAGLASCPLPMCACAARCKLAADQVGLFRETAPREEIPGFCPSPSELHFGRRHFRLVRVH